LRTKEEIDNDRVELKEIAVRLGLAVSEGAMEFLPVVGEALGRSDKQITFGATVKCKKSQGSMIECTLVFHEPKIPTPQKAEKFFVLERQPQGQLSFIFEGTIAAFEDELQQRDITPQDDKPDEE
jgi:hypothetical protein